MIKTLEGPKEPILDIVWHPLRPTIVTVSNYNFIYIWNALYSETWSAFAPNFKELEENEEYHEREDEFDIVEDQPKQKKPRIENDVVDIMTIQNILNDIDQYEEVFIPLQLNKDDV